MKNILVVGSSGQASLSTIKCLRLANKYKQKYRIITSDIDPLLIGIYIGDRGYLVKKETNEWIKDINNIVRKEKIDLIVSAHDIPLDILSERRDEIDAQILIASKESIRLTRDKYMLSQWLRENGFPYPETWKSNSLPIKMKFPVITKPRNGFGSRHFYKCLDFPQLIYMLRYTKQNGFDSIIQEYLDGIELSGMALVAKDGEILSITCAESVKKFGMSYKTVHGCESDDLDFKLLVSKIVGKMGIIGPVSIQGFRLRDGTIKIFEINPRFTGAQIVRAFGGVNGPEVLIDNWLDGTKSYPIISMRFIALWYADYRYIPYDAYIESYVESQSRKSKRKAIGMNLL